MPKLKSYIAELRRLYVEESWTLERIASRFDVSHQAIRYQLKKAGVELRSAGGKAPAIDPKVAADLYVNKRLTSVEVAAEFGTSFASVRPLLINEGVEIRKRGESAKKYADLRNLKIGESVVLPRPRCKGIWQGRFYAIAKKAGIRISVRAVDELSIRLTRVE